MKSGTPRQGNGWCDAVWADNGVGGGGRRDTKSPGNRDRGRQAGKWRRPAGGLAIGWDLDRSMGNGKFVARDMS